MFSLIAYPRISRIGVGREDPSRLAMRLSGYAGRCAPGTGYRGYRLERPGRKVPRWTGRASGPPEGLKISLAFWKLVLPRKEVIQPHVPVRLPCYDFTPLTLHTFDASPRKGWAGGFGCRRLGWCDGRCVQGPGTHSPRHADPRLLATPTSWGRVAAPNPNWGRLSGSAPPRGVATLCTGHCSTCAAQDIRGMMT